MSAEDLMRAASLWRAGVHDLFALSSQSIAHMDAMVGPSDSIVIAGGWIHDPMVRAAKKAALGAFRVSEVNEAGAMGAAMFAAISCGEMERPSATQTPRWQA
jgi:sugar (pentulose or hexulose) kinase